MAENYSEYLIFLLFDRLTECHLLNQDSSNTAVRLTSETGVMTTTKVKMETDASPSVYEERMIANVCLHEGRRHRIAGFSNFVHSPDFK
jgi:hypothetical protein